jgi:hypothetical protein
MYPRLHTATTIPATATRKRRRFGTFSGENRRVK